MTKSITKWVKDVEMLDAAIEKTIEDFKAQYKPESVAYDSHVTHIGGGANFTLIFEYEMSVRPKPQRR